MSGETVNAQLGSDLRYPEFEFTHNIDATNINFYGSDFTTKLNLIRKDVPIYVYCRSGGRSAKAVQKMKALGFDKVYNLLGIVRMKEVNNELLYWMLLLLETRFYY